MRILFVAAECAPIIKVGGLADVVGALPKALQAAGHDVRIIIPKYDQIDQQRFPSSPRWTNLSVPWNGQTLIAHIDEGRLPDSHVPVYFLDCPAMFHPGKMLHRLQMVYANSAEPEMMRQELERFVFFPHAVATTLPSWDWQPDILHVHDWHAAFLAVTAKVQHREIPLPSTLLTIHNLQNQGRWNPAEVWRWIGWTGASDPILALRDQRGNVDMLQLGIAAADAVNTVSPTYAKEILTPEYGEGLVETLAKVSGGVSGILNGIDNQAFNPATDAALAVRYDEQTVAAGKVENRKALSARLGFKLDPAKPLIVSVGRLTAQKGYQLLAPIAEWLFAQDAQLVILGSGTKDVETELEGLAKKYPSFHLQLGFDAQLAQLLYGAGDLFLMPSQFEPCGLGQMIAMRYGTLPIVRATGGLKDSVQDITTRPKTGTGFVFDEFTPTALQSALARALALAGNQRKFQAAQHRAMQADFSWDRSSQEYLDLYAKILSKKS